MDDNERQRKRREEGERLRRAARSTTPIAYQTRRTHLTDIDPMIDTKETYTNLFGAFTQGTTWQAHVASAVMLGAQGLACVALVIVLNIAQCSWWYEPGMYSDPDRIQTPGR